MLLRCARRNAPKEKNLGRNHCFVAFALEDHPFCKHLYSPPINAQANTLLHYADRTVRILRPEAHAQREEGVIIRAWAGKLKGARGVRVVNCVKLPEHIPGDAIKRGLPRGAVKNLTTYEGELSVWAAPGAEAAVGRTSGESSPPVGMTSSTFINVMSPFCRSYSMETVKLPSPVSSGQQLIDSGSALSSEVAKLHRRTPTPRPTGKPFR
eukprot:scaffold489_cov259-Pinguiococcus_pyrenoidosus.AAC.10